MMGVIGSMNQGDDNKGNAHCSCNQILSQEIGDTPSKTLGHLVLKTRVKHVLCPAQINKMFELNFNEQ